MLKKYKPKIVAVTGSVGKTSTKDAIYTVLATTFFVRKSSKSFNSEIGVPLTILGLPNAWNNPLAWLKNVVDGLLLIVFTHKYPEWLVLEVGADRPGDIASVVSWLRPEVAVVTRLSEVPVHVEFFSSAEQVRQEKAQLILGGKTAAEGGFAVLNGDDKLVSSMRSQAKGNVITFGTTNNSNIFGSDFRIVYDQHGFPGGIAFTASVDGPVVPVQIDSSIGRQHMYTALAALAVGFALKVDVKEAAEALRTHSAPPGRMKILPGKNGSCIIDDTYNSSPVAVHEALETLKNVQAPGRKILVLGDMLELGAHSPEEHRKLGLKAASVADEIYLVGTRVADAQKAALAAGFPADHIFRFDSSIAAGDALTTRVQQGDIILAKGSQGTRMEKLVERILAEPMRAGELLVRQDAEWRDR